MDDLVDHEIAFTWTDDRTLVVHVMSSDGGLIEYELEPSETRRLFKFLKEKLEPVEKIPQVLGNLADNKSRDEE
jgi:hypothetical protein